MSRTDLRIRPRTTKPTLKAIVENEEVPLHPLAARALALGLGTQDTPLPEPIVSGEPEFSERLELALLDTDTHPPDTANPALEPTWTEPPPALIFSDPGDPEPRTELLMHAVWQLHLRGYAVDAIGRKLGIGSRRSRRLLRKVKKATIEYMVENPQVFGAPLELLYTQVMRRRERQSALWEEIGDATMESVKPQFYRLIAEEDKAIEGLLGMSRETMAVVFGSPAQHASADLLRQAGPEGLKEILTTIRNICVESTGRMPTLESTQTIQGNVRELRGTES